MGEKVFILSLGCAKNQVDSENLAGMMVSEGFEIVDTPDLADIALVNTCAFIEPAVRESIDVALQLEELKNSRKVKKIGILGCLLNRYGDDLKKEFPTVDIWARAEEWEKVLTYLGKNEICFDSRARGFIPETVKWSRYLKIVEGCNNRCSYCTIPKIRGPLRSRPIGEIIEEAQLLVSQGAKELCLVGQDIAAYGIEGDGKPHLTELLKILDKELPPDTWVRLLYLHPVHIDEKTMDHIASCKKVLRYLDIPIQHVDDEVLSSMNRKVTEPDLKRIFSYAREIDPDFALRTTIMVGFPGEDDIKFQKVLHFLDEMEIDRVGAFLYSPEDGTEAANLKGQVPEKVKRNRYDTLMELQAFVSLRRQERFLNRSLKVLIEETDSYGGYALGRSFREAPEVDGLIVIRNADNLAPGSFAEVKVISASEHDMEAEVIFDEGQSD